jgi:hypothetical protein
MCLLHHYEDVSRSIKGFRQLPSYRRAISVLLDEPDGYAVQTTLWKSLSKDTELDAYRQAMAGAHNEHRNQQRVGLAVFLALAKRKQRAADSESYLSDALSGRLLHRALPLANLVR